MVTKRVIRINSSEAEHLAAKDLVAIAAAACDNGAAINNKASNEQSKSSKKSSAANSDDNCMDQGGGEKRRRSLPSWDTANKNNNEPTIKRRRQHKSFVIDISDVPPQPPIPKSKRYVKEGASKYTGVSFNKDANKWTAQIMIEGKQHTIGRRYDNEEEAAVDYARALFKYKGGGVKEDREQRGSFVIDLSDVPPQPPVPKYSGHVKKGASKYTGVCFRKKSNRWNAQIVLDGELRHIGCYNDEEKAAVDYARAVFKYREGVRHQNHRKPFAIDLSDVPPQPPIPKSSGRVKEGASKYVGVNFNKQKNKWHAQITIEGKQRHIGYYNDEKDAAVDYARALFKYKGGVIYH